MKSSKELTAEIADLMQTRVEMKVELSRIHARLKELDEHKRRVEKGVFFFDDDINGKFQTQEDKIKELEDEVARTASRSWHANERLDKLGDRIERHVFTLQDHDRRVRFLEEDVGNAWKRLNRLPIKDFPITWDQALEIMNGKKYKNGKPLESKPQDSRREVIKAARVLVEEAWPKTFTTNEAKLIYKALDIAQQSLEGGE
jgi:hypothetical protein